MDKDTNKNNEESSVEEFLSVSKDTTLGALARQIQTEYQVTYDHQNSKKKDLEVRLKLFNNQKRDKEAVGDTTMFTTFQTVLAALYRDKLSVEWIGREEGDDEHPHHR